jgi:hypothetical protein
MSNISTILTHLNLPKYDVVRDMIRAQFAAQVKSTVEAWYEEVKACNTAATPNHKFPSPGYARRFIIEPKHVGESGYYMQNAATKAAVIAGEYSINAAKVQEAADLEWQETKEFYAARVGAKIDALLEGDAVVECRLKLNNFLVGHVAATLGDKTLVLATSLKTNYRYGVFAANRDMTVYRQVPTLVHSYSGFDLPARELAIVRETLQAKENRKAAMLSAQQEIKLLERQKRSWEDIHHSLDYSAKYEKGQPLHQRHIDAINQKLSSLGLPAVTFDTLTVKSAYAKIKELRASLKAAKLKLREVRQPNSMEAVS